jgi:hypothetical protein
MGVVDPLKQRIPRALYDQVHLVAQLLKVPHRRHERLLLTLVIARQRGWESAAAWCFVVD